MEQQLDIFDKTFHIKIITYFSMFTVELFPFNSVMSHPCILPILNVSLRGNLLLHDGEFRWKIRTEETVFSAKYQVHRKEGDKLPTMPTRTMYFKKGSLAKYQKTSPQQYKIKCIRHIRYMSGTWQN